MTISPDPIDAENSHRIRRLPVLVLMPHSRCNCRCLMCDIWRANRHEVSLAPDTVERLRSELAALGVNEVALSGGEPLIHANLWSLCALLKGLPARITLISTGLLLERHASAVAKWCDEVIVSLDGPPKVHNHIRGVPDAFEKLKRGIATVRQHRRDLPVSARCVLQKRNFRHLHETIDAARQAGIDRISFLTADLTSTAFNRPNGWDDDRINMIAPSREESVMFRDLIETLIADRPGDFTSGFIVERPDRMRQLALYYLATHDLVAFPEVRCTAPWVSAVIEADGTVRPCFFHAPLGNIHHAPLGEILNSEKATDFRRALDVRSDATCRRCVCTLNR